MLTKNKVMKDGVVLTTRHFKAEIENPHGVVVATNSQAQHILNMQSTLAGLAKFGWDICGVDLRGHGHSSSARAPLGHMEIDGGWDLLVSDFINVLEAEFDGIPWDERMIVAPNIGGPLLLEVLKQWPDVAQKLVFITPPTNQPIILRLAKSFMKARILTNPADQPDDLTMHQMYSFLGAQLKDRKRLIDVVSSDQKLTDLLLDDPYSWPTPTSGYFYEMFRGIEKAWKWPSQVRVKTGTQLLLMYGSDDPMTANGKFVKPMAKQFEAMGIKDFSSRCVAGGRSGLFFEEDRLNISGLIGDWATSTESVIEKTNPMVTQDAEMAQISADILAGMGLHSFHDELAPEELVELCYNAINDENRWTEMLYRFAYSLSGDNAPDEKQLESLVTALMPHWDRSYKLNRQILSTAAVGAVLQNVIDHFEIGMAIVNAEFEIAYANPAFIRSLRTLCDDPGRIDEASNNKALTARLAPLLTPAFKALANGREGEAALMAGQAMVGIHFRPSALKQAALSRGGTSGVLVLRGVLDSSEPLNTSRKQLLEFAYGLTPKEAEAALGVLVGFSPERISKNLDISIHTTRTHLRRIYEKTAVQGQTELVAKLMKGPLGLLQ